MNIIKFLEISNVLFYSFLSYSTWIHPIKETKPGFWKGFWDAFNWTFRIGAPLVLMYNIDALIH
jgi:hypothetical protein